MNRPSNWMKFTAGPWRPMGARVDTCGGLTICKLPSAGFSAPLAERAGNAALIAAAPDLLAACEYIRDMLAQEFPIAGSPGERETMAARLGAVGGYRAAELIQSAIAAANGGA